MLLVYLFDDMVDGKECSIDTILLTAKIAVYIFERLQEISQGFNNLPQDKLFLPRIFLNLPPKETAA